MIQNAGMVRLDMSNIHDKATVQQMEKAAPGANGGKNFDLYSDFLSCMYLTILLFDVILQF